MVAHTQLKWQTITTELLAGRENQLARQRALPTTPQPVPELLQRKNELLSDLEDLDIPPSPLDALIGE